MEALQGVDPSNLHWTDLEQRPYFWAVIHESLRIMPGGSHRSARIARYEELFYQSQDGTVEWVIPQGTPIRMSAMINHFNEELFPDPQEFKPEWWLLEDGQPNHKLQKWLISFGKGSRSCVGEQ
jgi:cytochrome P450